MRVSNLVLPDIREALHAETAELSDALADFHAADLAEIVNDLDEEDTLKLLHSVPLDVLPGVFDYLDATRRAQLLSALPLPTAATIAEHMSADERVDLFA